MKLSVLDQSVISKGSTGKSALENTVQLAQLADELGYTRFWVAEHHNTNGIAGSSPEVLISHIASRTNKIRVGSGGVLLPQYSPYKVAENFKVLESLFPNRMDLGIGLSPGGSPNTRLALTDGIRKSLNEFPRNEAKNMVLTVEEKKKILENRKRMIVGTPHKVKNDILYLVEEYQTDEFMVIANVFDFEDKINSYTLLAETFL